MPKTLQPNRLLPIIKVLIVEDSMVVSEYLQYILSSDPQIQVIGVVGNGKKAIEFVQKQKPDIISMDIDMPLMDGLEATRIIMSTTPVPILIVTASRKAKEVSVSIDALAAGALGVIEKPVGLGHPDEKKLADNLVAMIKVYSEVRVISRRIKPARIPAAQVTVPRQMVSADEFDKLTLVAIGVSSGGPQALQQVFAKITEKFPVPIVVVQHITAGFLEGLVNWLGQIVEIPVQVALHGEELLPGRIYFAPDNHQMGVSRGRRAELEKCQKKTGLCPSVAHLFNSVTMNYGKSAMGIILTGMGSDGAEELKALRDTGALTIAQDKASSLIHGMPGVAIKLNAAKYVLSAEEISVILSKIELNL